MGNDTQKLILMPAMASPFFWATNHQRLSGYQPHGFVFFFDWDINISLGFCLEDPECNTVPLIETTINSCIIIIIKNEAFRLLLFKDSLIVTLSLLLRAPADVIAITRDGVVHLIMLKVGTLFLQSPRHWPWSALSNRLSHHIRGFLSSWKLCSLGDMILQLIYK